MTSVFVYRCFVPICARGLTNQLIFMFNTIEYINNNFPNSVIFLREFYSQYDDDNSIVPISEVLDIEHLNELNSNIGVFDLNNLTDTIITWGSQNTPFPTEVFINMLKNNHDLFQYNVEDPEPGCLKEICLEMPSRSVKYRFSENCGRIQNVQYTEHMNFPMGRKGNMFTEEVYKICSIIKFVHVPIIYDIEFNGRQCSVLHLRNEMDALFQWSCQNKMSVGEYERILNQKYIDLVEKYITKVDNILLILTSRRIQNPVIEHLEKSGYWIIFNIYENIGRERMAISDMIFASKLCNNIFISSGGSTYSVLLESRLQHTLHIFLDMNNIHKEEVQTPKLT